MSKRIQTGESGETTHVELDATKKRQVLQAIDAFIEDAQLKRKAESLS